MIRFLGHLCMPARASVGLEEHTGAQGDSPVDLIPELLLRHSSELTLFTCPHMQRLHSRGRYYFFNASSQEHDSSLRLIK